MIKKNRGGRGGKINSITFIPKFQPQFQDEKLERNQLQQQISSGYTLTREEVNYLYLHFGFTEDEIRKNIEVFKDVKAVSDLLNEAAKIRAKMNELAQKHNVINNQKGYLIGALRNLVISISENNHKKEPIEATKKTISDNPMNMLSGLANKKNINN